MKLTIPNLIIVFSFALLIIGAMSCNTEKRATRILYKSVRIDEKPARDYCAKVYNPIILTKDSIVYKQGETIKVQLPPKYIKVNCDSLIAANKGNGNKQPKNEFILPCPPCDSTYRLDSFIRASRSVEVNTAEIDRLGGLLSDCDKDKAALEQALKMWKIIALIAILLIVLYIVLKFVIGKFR